MITFDTNIDYLIPYLRMHLGDLNPASYRYLDTWLRTALVAAVKELSRYWDSKYILDPTIDTVDPTLVSGVFSGVLRNELFPYFEFEAPPLIQFKDEAIIILMASIIIKSGQLENLSWDLGNWRDAELSFSNIESSKSKDASLERDKLRLQELIKPPMKRLFNTLRTNYVSNE
jgi:hypothetical protein